MNYRLRDFGSYTVGGRVHHEREGEPFVANFTRTASYEVDPRGHFAIEHGYVQYFVPERRNDGPPIVLVHGGGMSGTCWETTPDGRPGWLHLLLKRGHEVHVLDNVERGRAGFAPGYWPGQPLLRSMEEAWSLFRIGPPEGFPSRTAFAGQKFPVSHFDTFARSFVPRWLTTTKLHTQALLSVLRRVGPSHVICHSQGGEIAFDALLAAPETFASIIALEPSGYPASPEDLHETRVRIVMGDFLNVDPLWEARRHDWLRLSNAPNCDIVGPDDFGAGNSHMLMQDKGADHVLQVAIASFE